LGFWGAKFPQNVRFTAWDAVTPMNRRAKFDAANFILGGEIRNRKKTNKQNYTQK